MNEYIYIYNLKKAVGEVDGDEAGAAAHAAEVAADDVAAELVAVDDHGGERRDRVEGGDVDHQNPNVSHLHVRLLEQGVDGAKYHHLRLLHRALERPLRREVLQP